MAGEHLDTPGTEEALKVAGLLLEMITHNYIPPIPHWLLENTCTGVEWVMKLDLFILMWLLWMCMVSILNGTKCVE